LGKKAKKQGGKIGQNGIFWAMELKNSCIPAAQNACMSSM